VDCAWAWVAPATQSAKSHVRSLQDEEEIVTRFLAAGMGPLFFSPGFLTTAAVAVAELIWQQTLRAGFSS
jgi:hypothetical protein